MKVIGIAGTAKNTGKTTAIAALINSITGVSGLCVTSIGYDGEAVDNVTGLPKPRLHLPEGALVVTADSCLPAGSAVITKLEITGLSTPLGRLVIGRVQRPGLVVLAGPNSEKALRTVIGFLKKYNVCLLLVDGALGRLAPMSAAAGLVIATGASRSTDTDKLLAEVKAFEFLLSLPVLPVQEPVLTVPSLLVDDNTGVFLPALAGANTVDFTGVVDIKPFLKITEALECRSALPLLLFRDPVRLLLCGDPEKMALKLRAYNQKGGLAGVRSPLKLLAVTVNPFYPRCDKAGKHYAAAIDREKLYETFSEGLGVPVVDVVRQGGERLAKILCIQPEQTDVN